MTHEAIVNTKPGHSYTSACAIFLVALRMSAETQERIDWPLRAAAAFAALIVFSSNSMFTCLESSVIGGI